MDEEEDIVAEAEDEFEQGQDISDGQIDQFDNLPSARPETTAQYNWFWRVVRLNKPFRLAKVGNLNNPEIGDHVISMRDAMNLAHLGQIFRHNTFGNYWATRSKITAATSMARKGWFMDLSISQKKVRERQRNASSSEQKNKWRLFQKKTQQEQAAA